MADPCSKCGQTHDPEKCTGHNGRGLPCGNRPIRGGSVCSTHGGSAPQVKAAAEQRQVEAKADEAITKLWPGLSSASPVKDPVGSMERLAGALEGMLDQVGAKVNALDHMTGGKDLTQLRGELVLLDKVAGHLRLLLESMARLGIAERYVQLEEERASIVVAAFVGALEVLGLVPADKDLATRRFLELLGDVVPGEVVAS